MQFVFLSLVIYLLLNAVVIILYILGMFPTPVHEAPKPPSLYLRQVEILSPRLPRQFAGAAYQFAMNASLVAAWLATARLTPRWSDGDPIDVTARVR